MRKNLLSFPIDTESLEKDIAKGVLRRIVAERQLEVLIQNLENKGCDIYKGQKTHSYTSTLYVGAYNTKEEIETIFKGAIGERRTTVLRDYIRAHSCLT